MNKLSFVEKASIGIKKVQNMYPSAVLLEVDAWKSVGSTLNPDELDLMRIVFSLDDTKSVFIKSIKGNTFNEPVVVNKPFLEDAFIENWPIKMDLLEALDLIKEAGMETSFNAVTLRQPMAPGFENPLYIVGSGGSYVSVNTVTKEVQAIQSMLGSQWADITICAYGLEIKGHLKVSCGTDPSEKGEHIYSYPEGVCTSLGKWGNFNNWSMYGAEGDLTLYEKTPKSEIKICQVHYESPYIGTNVFSVGQVAAGYQVQITSAGNTGHSGYLGNCSLNVFKN